MLKGALAENNNDLVTTLALYEPVCTSGVPKTDLFPIYGNMCSHDVPASRSQIQRLASSYVDLSLLHNVLALYNDKLVFLIIPLLRCDDG